MDKIHEFEKTRKNCTTLITIGILVVFVGIITIFLLGQTNFTIVGIIVVFIGIILAIVGIAKFSLLTKHFKNEFMHKFIQEIIPGATYNSTMGIPLNDIYNCGFLARADRAHTEDLINGQIDGVSFKTCDLKLEEKHVHHNPKGGTVVQYITYFQGRYFEIDFNKEFKGKLFVTEGRLPTIFSKYKKVDLESEEFNRKFKTYTAEQLTAFYILTPHLMTSLLELERRNPGVIAMSFSNSKLLLAIDNRKDTFNLRLFKAIDDKFITEMRKDIEVIKDIIIELKLNRNIFIKED